MVRENALEQGQGRSREIVLFGMFTALIDIGDIIRITEKVSQFKMTNIFTTLAGRLLVSKKGALSVGLYVLLGLVGVPVFTEGGGPSYIFQPTFGYLVGFIAGAWLTGKLREMSGSWSFGKVLFANLCGLAVENLFGMIYVYFINNFYIGKTIGVWAVSLYCFLLAVPGDICLCILAAFLSKRLVKALGIYE